MANRLRGRCGFSVAKAGLHSRPYFLRRFRRRSFPSRTVRARLRILNLISYESRNVTINVPTAAKAARASKTFDISDTSKGKHRPRAGIRRCDSTSRAAAGDVRPPQIGLPQGCTITSLIIYVLPRRSLSPRGRPMISGSTGPILFLPQGCTITSLIIYVL